MKIARRIFLTAGLYGLLVLIPGLFADPQNLSSPEYYYGFYGSALVWQLMFLIIASDPQRWRNLMPLAMMEKAAFFLPCLWLYASGRLTATPVFLGGMIDGVLLILFGLAWRHSRSTT